ncbi:acid protease [Thelephora terrestris]|uniref:Acid protease n=1 Tax=Thelephora terrestris TaxID=56493 RepID=A0A9P6HRC0_9AGAM|nr:acid protease [Thelephora terrestris]
MKFLLPSSIVPLLLSCLDLVGAVRLEIHGRSSRQENDARAVAQRRGSSVEKRSNIYTDNGIGILTNSDDISYYTSLTLGGKNFSSVLVDTGHSDLWVGGNVPGALPSGQYSRIQYAVGSAEGPIEFADLDFLGYNVPKQAFISATGKDDGSGLIGLGPNRGSNIKQLLKNSSGNAVLDRIFLSNTSTPNYLTVLLGRSDDPTDLFPGDITVGELVPGFENVTQFPKLPVTQVSVRNQADQHWQILIDKNGIIGPDGQVINVTSIVDGGPRLNAVLDTGFSLPQVPRQVSDAIYGRIPGATFGDVGRGAGQTWSIPCDAEVNLTFIIGGVQYPIHPLDTSLSWNANGTDFCIGSFQPRTTTDTNYDVILGMAFLRNAYMLVNFGDFVDGKTDQVADPYVQLLPTTEMVEAHNDFVQVRLKGIDTTAGQTFLDSFTPSGPPDVKKSNGGFSGWLDKNKTILIAVGASVGGVLLILVAALCFRRRRRANVREKDGRRVWFKGTPVGGKGGYKPVHHPTPSESYLPSHGKV